MSILTTPKQPNSITPLSAPAHSRDGFDIYAPANLMIDYFGGDGASTAPDSQSDMAGLGMATGLLESLGLDMDVVGGVVQRMADTMAQTAESRALLADATARLDRIEQAILELSRCLKSR